MQKLEDLTKIRKNKIFSQNPVQYFQNLSLYLIERIDKVPQKRKERMIPMYTTKRTLPRKFLAITMAIVMALTMTVSAFAFDYRPYNADATSAMATVSAETKIYTVTVIAPSGTTKVMFDATLYQKQLTGRKQISTMSASSDGVRCFKSKSATIEKGKTYVIEVTAKVYSGGVWDTVEKTLTVKT